MLKIYNTASRRLEQFKPAGEVVKIYTCGPTVYNFQHIGNYAAYIYWDLLIRTLKMDGYAVKRVLNFTDVGHLVSDGDEGEDKLEKGAAREGKSVYEIAKFYGDDFLRNFRALNLIEPDVIAHATDYIEADKRAVDKMTEAGFTYETTDGVYFDTSKFERYADFAKLDLEGLKAGARVGFNSEKHDASDFAVWKFIQPGEKHAMRWDYLGRPGYPGWHLECSTIIHEELGEPIDIHTGGADHIPVHHTNEIAQTFAMTGRELSRYWMHCNFITIDGEKISKSLGNVYTLDDLAERWFSPMDFKMWVLSGHYQGTRNFTFEGLAATKQRRLNWRNKIALLYQKASTASLVDGVFKEILSVVNNNFNSAEAFSIIDTSELSMEDWKEIDELFGLNLINDSPDVNDAVRDLISERQAARDNKNFARSDEIREELKSFGIAVEDTPTGPIWQYI
ncbi:cysteine--tRNA ligase [Candidatus Saccharibacteria bacterium]|nr:cysteine--tRNA ligase [Candidatus Saccharibacteria bacterium]